MKTLSEKLNLKFGKVEGAHVMHHVERLAAYDTLCLACAELGIDLSEISDSDFESASIILGDFCAAANEETGFTVSAWFDDANLENEMNTQTEKTYMNTETGSTGIYAEWDYTAESGETVNAVDLGEVVEVVKNEAGDWEEV